MQEAFVGAQSERIDIFGLASSLAGGEEPPSGLFQEFVEKADFVKELRELLDSSGDFDQELKERKELLIQQRAESSETQRM